MDVTENDREKSEGETTCCLANFALDWKRIKAEATDAAESTDDIIKARSDEYQYRYICLENDLKVLLISTVDSSYQSSSAAAIDVKAGSFSDPPDFQGLAHLCEHVLFTGSTSYPYESYSSFLGQRGGSSNAYTTSEHTNFHFEIPPNQFRDALDRFVSFFECPIFRDTCVDHELESVQSEHEKNRWDDAWRANQVERATANDRHPFSRFAPGTKQSLTLNAEETSSQAKSRSLKYELFRFFKSNYSANLMTACILHNQPLNELEKLAKEFLLRIPNKKIPSTIWSNKVFRKSQMKTRIYILPIKNIYHLNLTFPMEDFLNYYREAPEGYVAQIIGHKGPGGLYANLKERGYAHHLIATCRILARGFSFFIVTVHMTETGERHVDEIVWQVFQYIKLIRTTGVQKWFFDEISFISRQQFENKDRDRGQNYVSNISNGMHLFRPQDALSGDYIISNYRPDLILKVLRYLSPENVRVTILSQNCKCFVNKVEPHYGTEYHMEKIPETTMADWINCSINSSHKLPVPNDLIDREMAMVQIDNPVRYSKTSLPELFILMDQIRMRCWFKPALQFDVAKAVTFVKFSLPELVTKDAKSCNLSNLFVFLIRDALSTYSYCGNLAGLFFTLRPTRDGIVLDIRGYSANQHIFLQNILKEFYSMTLSESGFNHVLDVHSQGLRDENSDSLRHRAKLILNSILCPRAFTRLQRLRAIDGLNFKDLVKHADVFRIHSSIECFFYGNLTLEQANIMTSLINEERKEFLLRCIDDYKAKMEVNSHLEDSFLTDSTVSIAMAEEALVDIVPRPCKPNSSLADDLKKNGITQKGKNQEIPEIIIYIPDDHEKGEGKETDLQSTDDPFQNKSCQAHLLDLGALSHKDELKLPSESSTVFVIDNELNSTSCVLYFLQFKENTPTNIAVIETFFNLVRVPLISSMKSVVPLGYVVGCDIRRINNTLGFRIIVESQYPLSLVHSTIERSLEELDEFLEGLNEDSFEMCREAIVSRKKEVWANMKDSADNLWKEIEEQTYNFKRTNEEIKALDVIGMDDVKQFYVDWIRKEGSERRNVIISIGPDPVLNRLDGRECLSVFQVPEIQSQCQLFPRLSPEAFKQWFSDVFQCESNEYDAPSY